MTPKRGEIDGNATPVTVDTAQYMRDRFMVWERGTIVNMYENEGE